MAGPRISSIIWFSNLNFSSNCLNAPKYSDFIAFPSVLRTNVTNWLDWTNLKNVTIISIILWMWNFSRFNCYLVSYFFFECVHCILMVDRKHDMNKYDIRENDTIWHVSAFHWHIIHHSLAILYDILWLNR